jgi:hypothetical protein
MIKYLVSIIGNQTLPNILPIKEFDNQIHKHIFISTSKVQTELSWVKNLCNIEENQCINLPVDENDISDILEKLEGISEQFNNDDLFLVNLTGGNKVMSLGVFQFFSQSNFNSEMFYLNIGSNILRQVYPLVPHEMRDKPLNYRLNVEEFLLCYGASIQNKHKIFTTVKDKNYTKVFFDKKWSKKPIISKLRTEDYQSKGIVFSDIPPLLKKEIKEFLQLIGFKLEISDRLTAEEVKYLTGGWWEEYCFNYIKDKFNIQEPYIAIGLQNTKTNNELDLSFVLNNVLYVFECKTTVFNKDDFEDYVYKLAAIKDNKNGFGITVKAYLVTNLFKMVNNEIDVTFKKRAEAFNVKLIDSSFLQSINFSL